MHASSSPNRAGSGRIARSLITVGLAGATLALAALAACSSANDPAPRTGTIYGARLALGNGTASAYVKLDRGAPVELGIAISEAAMNGLPAGGGAPGGMPGMGHGQELLLQIPSEASALPFKLVQLNWNPDGHVPVEIYGVPHFDFHFYTISNAERLAIDPAAADFAQRAANMPAAAYVPPRYLAVSALAGIPAAAATEPAMGLHWLDPMSSEFNGQTFTKTFIYGSWNGKFIFAEPMITKAYLEQRTDEVIPVSVADRHEPSGYWPGAYRIAWDAAAKEYHVALTSFARHD